MMQCGSIQGAFLKEELIQYINEMPGKWITLEDVQAYIDHKWENKLTIGYGEEISL